MVSINNIMTELSKNPKNGQWRCEICEFDNFEGLSSCQMCESPKKKEPKNIDPHNEGEGIMKELKEPGIICPNKACNHYNSLYAEICSKCKASLFKEAFHFKPEKHSAKAKLKYCYICAFENHPSNKTCVHCDVNLLEKVIWTISMGNLGGKAMRKKDINDYHCEDCGGKVELVDSRKNAIGLRIQYSDFICRKCSNLSISEGKLCVFCDQKLSKEEMEFHDDICQPRTAFFKREGNPTFDRCSKLQVEAIHYMHKKCQEFHKASKYMLFFRIKRLGYNEKDLENLHHYIMHYAPIIIHIRAANFQYFTKDTHYRNCFEVAKRNVSSRVQWEDRMFDHKHHKASFFERVKYGTMNFTNDPKGVNACVGYGQSYFLLKSHVRDRCTITDMDSSSPQATIGTFRFIFHVLMKLSDAELKAAFEGSKGKEMLSNVIGSYKEIQIHGPVEFSKDIERVYLCRQQFAGDHGNVSKLATEFCEKNKLEHEFFDRNMSEMMKFGAINAVKVEKAPERILGQDSKLKQDKKEAHKERDHLKHPGYFYDPYAYQEGYEEIYDEAYDDEHLYQ